MGALIYLLAAVGLLVIILIVCVALYAFFGGG